jgi:acyl carrier protein
VLVTGALGGMGVAICRLLLERYRCSLLLVGRTDPHAPAPAAADPGAGAGLGLAQAVSERRAALAALQSLGEVLYVAADVADGAAMAAAVAAARERFGRPLDGALHLAGTFPARLLAEETPETLRATLRPKLDGARVVDGLLGPDAFLVLAGSVYGTFGGVAAGAYAAACSALQGLALERRGRAASTWCLAFSNWDEVGMSRGYAYRERSQALGYRMIERNRGLLSLRAALALADPFVLIGLDAARPNVRRLLTGAPEPALELVGVYTGDGDPLAVEVADAFGRPSRCDLRRVDALDGGDGAVAGLAAAGPLLPRNQMERTIAACWRDVLALTEIDIDRTFFELGGQSLQLVQVVGRLQTTLGREIGVVEMFRYPTVRTLARHLAAHGEPAGRRFEHAAARAEKQRQALRRPRPGRRR